jgi:hypothetical protein
MRTAGKNADDAHAACEEYGDLHWISQKPYRHILKQLNLKIGRRRGVGSLFFTRQRELLNKLSGFLSITSAMDQDTTILLLGIGGVFIFRGIHGWSWHDD